MKVLIPTDGSTRSIQAAAFANSLHLVEGAEILLLGLEEPHARRVDVEACFVEIERQLSGAKTVRQKMRTGDPSHQIMLEASENEFDIVVIGREPKRRPTPLTRSTGTQELTRKLASHLLLVQNPPERVQRILVCSSGEPPSGRTLSAAGRLIAPTQASVSLVHVMSQVALKPDSPIIELEEDADHAIERATREGDQLKNGLRALADGGVISPIEPILRHGLVVDEVLEELNDGNYDLIVLGSHYQPGLTRWMDVLLDNITGELLNRVSCSILIVAPVKETGKVPG